MVKRSILVLVILLALTGIVSAQEGKTNSVVLHGAIGGGALTYEYMFNRHFSVLADVSYTNLDIVDEIAGSVKARWYPFGKAFFFDLGLGYTYGHGIVDAVDDVALVLLTLGLWLLIDDEHKEPKRKGGFLVSPGMGWKIELGRSGAFVMPISMGVNFKFGDYDPDFMPYFRIGLGYSF